MAILESRTKTGLSWVKESIALFRKSPNQWLLLALSYVGIFMMMPSIPGLQFFAFLTVLLWPVFIAMAMRLYQSADIGRAESLGSTIQSVQPKFSALVLLGLLCLAYAALMGLLLGSDFQALAQLSQKSGQITNAEAETIMQKTIPLVLKVVLFSAPLLMATWFSPMLIAFNNYTLVKAIKSSIAGSLQYFVSLGVSWLLLAMLVIGLVLITGLLLGLIGAFIPFAAKLLLPMLVFGSLLLASALMLAFQYLSYRDVFRAVVKG